MAPHAIGSGSLSFGLVNVPIKVYSTNRSQARVSFHWLHEACGGRVRQQYYCPKDDKVVGRDELVRGYEVSKGRYVPVEEEELEEVRATPRESIDILEFVPAESVDVLYLDHAYYLAPDKGGAKGYAVLAEAMRRGERLAIASYAARGGEHIVAVRVDGDVMVMHQLRFADEVRPPGEIPVEKPKVSERELALAQQLIAQTSEDRFDPAAHPDQVKRRLRALVERKSAAGEVATEEATAKPAAGGKVIDLMDALKASLATRARAPAAKKPAKPATGRRRGRLSGTRRARGSRG
jgi:DNA end-binding protein Ku